MASFSDDIAASAVRCRSSGRRGDRGQFIRLQFELLDGSELSFCVLPSWSVRYIKEAIRSQANIRPPLDSIAIVRQRDSTLLDDLSCGDSLDLGLLDGEKLQVVLAPSHSSVACRPERSASRDRRYGFVEGLLLHCEFVNGEEITLGVLPSWTICRIKTMIRNFKQSVFDPPLPLHLMTLIRLKDGTTLDDSRCCEPLDLDLQHGERLQVVLSSGSSNERS